MAKKAKAGRLICFDAGAYSDYHVVGFFVALKDFDPEAEIAKYLDLHPEQKESYCFERDEFMAYLIGEGLLVEVEYSTFYIGGYSSCKTARFDE